jgi:hypothetical protein
MVNCRKVSKKMRNIFLFVLIIFISGCSSEKHLEFYDVPIDGNLDVFANELIKLGFVRIQSDEENQIKLKGEFVEKECEIDVFATNKSKTVYKLEVNLPKERRDSLQHSFEKIQELCASKYGIGKSKYHQYRNPDRFHFNEPRRVRKLNPGDFTRYITPKGTIIAEVRSGYISVSFTDKHNSEIQKREEEQGRNAGLPASRE